MFQLKYENEIKQLFDWIFLLQTFKDPEGHGLTAFDYRSPDTCLISDDKGDVLLIDLRVKLDTIERFDASSKRIRGLQINPKHTDEFCISGLDQYVVIPSCVFFSFI